MKVRGTPAPLLGISCADKEPFPGKTRHQLCGDVRHRGSSFWRYTHHQKSSQDSRISSGYGQKSNHIGNNFADHKPDKPQNEHLHLQHFIWFIQIPSRVHPWTFKRGCSITQIMKPVFRPMRIFRVLTAEVLQHMKPVNTASGLNRCDWAVFFTI